MEPALLFIGVLVSLLVQLVKTVFKTTTVGTLLTVAALSVFGSIGAYLLAEYGLYDSAVQILATAGAFYAFILRTLEKEEE